MNMEVKKINLGYFNHAAAATHPDKTALIDLSREEDHVLTHSELDYRMDSVATLLSKLGMSAGDRLLLAMGNRFEFIEIFFGAMRAGLIPIPLNIKLGSDTINFVIKDSGCAGAIIEPGCNPEIVNIVEQHNLATLLAIDPAPAGWTNYE